MLEDLTTAALVLGAAKELATFADEYVPLHRDRIVAIEKWTALVLLKEIPKRNQAKKRAKIIATDIWEFRPEVFVLCDIQSWWANSQAPHGLTEALSQLASILPPSRPKRKLEDDVLSDRSPKRRETPALEASIGVSPNTVVPIAKETSAVQDHLSRSAEEPIFEGADASRAAQQLADIRRSSRVSDIVPECRKAIQMPISDTTLEPEQLQGAYENVDLEADNFFLACELDFSQGGDQTIEVEADVILSFLNQQFKGEKCVLKLGEFPYIQVKPGEQIMLSWKMSNDLANHLQARRSHAA